MANSNQELVSKHKDRRYNWRTLTVAAGIGVVVIVLIILAAVLLSTGPGDEVESPPGGNYGTTAEPIKGLPSITLEDFVQGRLSAQKFNGSWISDSEILYKSEDGHVMIFNLDNNSSRRLIHNEAMGVMSAFQQEISADGKFLLIAHSYQKLFRHTFLARYDVMDLVTLRSTPILPVGGGESSRNLQLVVWSPVGNGLVFVHDNNIFYKPKADDDFTVVVTKSGKRGSVYNGVPDWVYEEEVLSSNKALWFSPTGKKLAYATFDDTAVRLMAIPFYGKPSSLESQYTKMINIRYPKPGTSNPKVSLYVVDLAEPSTELKTIQLPAPTKTVTDDNVLTAVTWATPDELVPIWMNRVQNTAVIASCRAETGNCNTLLDIVEAGGWVELFEPPFFSSDGSKFTLILPHGQGDSGDFRHVTLVEKPNFTPVALTSGKFVVTEILGWDENRHKIYFMATEEARPSKLHLYQVDDSVPSAPHKAECISCNVKNLASSQNCDYNSASFSKNFSFYVLTCGGPGVPQVTLHNKERRQIATWEANHALNKLLSGKSLPDVRTLEVDVPGGFKAQVRMWLPPNLDTSGKTKYPLLINVYGGPDSFQVTDRFTADWSTYLTTNKSIIYAAIDGRGSGLKGNSMLYAGYRKLGTVEIEDQVNVTRYLQNTFSFIDKTRSAIWGWSYGGYSTVMALAKDTEGIFKCGMSVAPVTDWIYYDTIYTERYMGLPTVVDNLEGYKAGTVTDKVANLRNKMYYLIHGTADDNVHYQQSMMLSRALEQRDILFRQQSYPDEEHGLSGIRQHLYHSLGEFLNECFNLI